MLALPSSLRKSPLGSVPWGREVTLGFAVSAILKRFHSDAGGESSLLKGRTERQIPGPTTGPACGLLPWEEAAFPLCCRLFAVDSASAGTPGHTEPQAAGPGVCPAL